jgi:hypothetical protein
MRRLAVSSLFLFPLVAGAASIEDIFGAAGNIVTQIIQLLLVVGTVVFMWGVVRYVGAGGDEEKVREGRNLMMVGIIGLAIMISVWGIVKLVTTSFNIGSDKFPNVTP